MTVELDVCVCTYRRASVAETLLSIAAQRMPDDVSIRVIVADNDETPSAKALVEERCRALGLRHHYVHAPARNISIGRNAALDAARAPIVVFIDDDEIATPYWIAALLACHQRTGATIVFGPVDALYDDGPLWLREADLHSIRPVFRPGEVIETGYTCNVLMDYAAMTDAMRAARFDLALGRSGGEDSFFFHHLHALGATMSYAGLAIVREHVPAHRGRLGWLLRRSFRSGQTHARVLLAKDGRRPVLAATAAGKCVWCVMGIARHAASPAKWRSAAVRAALHMGVVARLAGLSDLQIY